MSKMVEDMSLLPDFTNVCTKAPEDFAALLAMRVAQRKEADEKRLADERENIRAEEQEKARTEISHAIGANKAVPQVAAAPAAVNESLTTGGTIRLGEICTRLGLTVTADFMAHLGFPFVAHDKNAKLYHANDFQSICEAIASHCIKAGRMAQKAA